MRINRFKRSAVVFLSIFLLTASIFCSKSVGQAKKPIPEYVKNQILAGRSLQSVNENQGRTSLENSLYKYDSYVGDYVDSAIFDFAGSQPFRVRTSDALADVDLFFRLLKFGYAGYQHMGGDEVFLRAKENIVAEVEKSGEQVLRANFSNILRANMNFLQDSNFLIENERQFKRYSLYTDESYFFIRDGRGYYVTIENEKYYLQSIDKGRLEDYLYLSLDREGNLVYLLGIFSFSTDKVPIDVKITLRGDKGTRTETVPLKIATYNPDYSTSKAYNFKESKGISILEIRRLMAENTNLATQLQGFVRDAVKLKNTDYIIIDLRGNLGGQIDYGQRWLNNYISQSLYYSHFSTSLCTNIALEARQKIIDGIKDVDQKNRLSKKLGEDRNHLPGWSPIQYLPLVEAKNPNIIIVLMDRYSSGACEDFIYMLRRMNNVILIGENSMGGQLIGDVGNFILPNTKVAVSFGSTMRMNSQLKDNEGIGCMPDIWVNPQHTSISITKFVEKYNLEGLKY